MTTALPNSWISLPSEFDSPRLAVAWVVKPCGDTERVQSNKPVTLIRGTDQFTADTMDYDNLTGIANLNGRVRGTMVPSAKAAGTAGKR